MYLSKLELNSNNRQVRGDVLDCYQLHRTVLSAFGDKQSDHRGARETFNVLYRLSPDPVTNNYSLLVQSASKPDWSRLPMNYFVNIVPGSLSSQNVTIKDISPLMNHLEEGMKLRFRLFANPTKKIGTTTKEERLSGKKKSHGKRVQLTADLDLINWLKRKGEQHGFLIGALKLNKNVPNMDMTEKVKFTGYKKKNSPEQKKGSYLKINLQGITFEGILKITRVQDFKEAIMKGIGPSKAFGFGLLSIARINR